jgi:hypothetical protein
MEIEPEKERLREGEMVEVVEQVIDNETDVVVLNEPDFETLNDNDPEKDVLSDGEAVVLIV